MEKLPSSSSTFQSRTSTPPSVMRPAATSQNRAMSCVSVVFPEPLGPTMAHVVRAGMASDTRSITVRFS